MLCPAISFESKMCRNEWAARESVVAAGPAERGCGFFDFFLYLFGIVDVAQSGCFFFGFWLGEARRGWIEDTRIGGLKAERLKVWRGVEDAADLTGESIFKIHGAEAEQLVDGAGDRAHAGVIVAHRARLDPGTGD